jgi:uncharacterized protein (TIGR02246 family)
MSLGQVARAPGECPAATPAALAERFAAAMRARDADAAAACFTRDGCFVTPDATTIRGRGEIRAVLAQLLAICLRIEIELRTVVEAGDTAMVSEHWRVSFKSVGGASFVRATRSTMVLSEVEGKWRLAVAAPWYA